MLGLQSGGKYTKSLLMCVLEPALVISLHCVLVSRSIQRKCLASEVPLDVLILEGKKLRGDAVYLFQRIMNRIFLRKFGFWWKLGRIRFSTVSSR